MSFDSENVLSRAMYMNMLCSKFCLDGSRTTMGTWLKSVRALVLQLVTPLHAEAHTVEQPKMHLHVIGPIVTEFLCPRPSATRQCCPCIGPRSARWQHRSTLFPKVGPDFCICNGHGFCHHTLDLGPWLTSRCTCPQNCVSKPQKAWTKHAWDVVEVLKFGSKQR